MSGPEGYEHKVRDNGDIAVFHHGKLVKLFTGAERTQLKKKLARKTVPEQVTLHEAMEGAEGEQHLGTGPRGPKGLSGDGRSHAPRQFFRRNTGG